MTTTGCPARPTSRWAAPNTNTAASPTGTRSAGTWVFTDTSGIQVVKIFDQAGARTGLRNHQATTAGFDLVAIGSRADDHKVYYPGRCRVQMRVTGGRGTGRLLGMQLFGHKNAEIARRTDIAATGSGSTFDAPFFDLAFANYHRQRPAVSISYAAVGSSAGIAAFSADKADFGASDVPMTVGEQAAATGGPSVQVPVDLGAEVVAYNLSLPSGQRLHLTGPVIARIFLGQITHWNDPAITALNPGIDLPNAPITVVHRSDGSGTTYIFSNYLSSVDPAWAAKVGTGKTLHWPVGQGAEGNGGVGTAVYTTLGALWGSHVAARAGQQGLAPFA
jgi:hypothetical protein